MMTANTRIPLEVFVQKLTSIVYLESKLSIKMSEFDYFFKALQEEDLTRRASEYKDTIKKALDTDDVGWLQILFPIPRTYGFEYTSNSLPARNAMCRSIEFNLPDLASFLLENRLVTLSQRERWRYAQHMTQAIFRRDDQTLVTIAGFLLRLDNKADFFNTRDAIECLKYNNISLFKTLIELDRCSDILNHGHLAESIISHTVANPDSETDIHKYYFRAYPTTYPKYVQNALSLAIEFHEESLLRLLLSTGANLQSHVLDEDPRTVNMFSIFVLDKKRTPTSFYCLKDHIASSIYSNRDEGYGSDSDYDGEDIYTATNYPHIVVSSSFNRLLLGEGFDFYVFDIPEIKESKIHLSPMMKIRAWTTVPLIHERLKVFEQKKFESEGCLLDMKAMLECISSF